MSVPDRLSTSSQRGTTGPAAVIRNAAPAMFPVSRTWAAFPSGPPRPPCPPPPRPLLGRHSAPDPVALVDGERITQALPPHRAASTDPLGRGLPKPGVAAPLLLRRKKQVAVLEPTRRGLVPHSRGQCGRQRR